MKRGTRMKRRTLPHRSSTRWWWVLALAATAFVVVGTIAYFSRPDATAGPQEVAVTEIEHVHGLAVDPSRADILWIGTHGSLIRVADGKRWTRIGAQTYDMMGFNVHPSEPNVFLTSGHPGPKDNRPNPLGIEISRDGGQTWKPVAMAGLADFHAMAISPADPQRLWAWNASGRAGLYRSQDGGKQWEYLRDSDLGGIFALAVHPQSPDVILAGASRGLNASTDAGVSWRIVPSLSGMPVSSMAIHPKDPRIFYAYALRADLGLIRSADGGKQWTAVGFFLGPRDAVGNIALDPVDPNTLYFATHGGDLYRSRDGGKTRERWVAAGRISTR